MLVEFKVENFRSFSKEVIFSMEAGTKLKTNKDSVCVVGGKKLLKSSVIFGANANGKTNLISALMLLRFLILNPTENSQQKLPTDTFYYNSRNTKFNISFIVNNNLYLYNLEYNANEIVYENLTKNDICIIKREKQNFIILPKQLEIVKDNIRANQNLIYFAQANNVEDAKEVFLWFSKHLVYVNTDMINNTVFKCLKNPKFKKLYLKFLKAADFNIVDIDIKEKIIKTNKIRFSLNQEQQPINLVMPDNEEKIYDVYLKHRIASNKYNQIHISNESSGTRVFMIIAIYIITSQNTNRLFLIDEFNKSFHLELASSLLNFFNSKQQNSQFIVTSHDLALMDEGLRQDQIWFADKNEFGETSFYSIFDFDDVSLKRSDFGYRKRYLQGRYGAMQIVISDIFEEIVGEINE